MIRKYEYNLTKDQAAMFEKKGNCLYIEGRKFMFLPYWFEENKETGTYYGYSFGDLPPELKDALEDFGLNEGGIKKQKIMTKEEIKLECLRIVVGRGSSMGLGNKIIIDTAKQLYEFVAGD